MLVAPACAAVAVRRTHSIPMKARRQSLLLELVQREPVRSQEQLRRRMQEAGFDVTQATLSRDIRDLGLVKGGADGAYQAVPRVAANGHAAKSLLHRALADYLTRIDRVQQLVLLRTGPGQAPMLGVAIDTARFPEVVGTLAGDDTILAITRDARRARAFVRRIESLAQGVGDDSRRRTPDS